MPALGLPVRWEKSNLCNTVYVELDRYGGFVLTTETGFESSNTIILELEVRDGLTSYTKRDNEEGIGLGQTWDVCDAG
jgi:hypothetical protein